MPQPDFQIPGLQALYSALQGTPQDSGSPDTGGMQDISGSTADMANPLAVALSGVMPAAASFVPPPQAQSAPPPQDNSPGFLQSLASALSGGAPATNSRYDPSSGDFLPAAAQAAYRTAAAPQAAPAAAAPQPAVSGYGGQASLTRAAPAAAQTPDEDATTAAYRALHDEAVSHYDSNMAAARAAVAAGRDPSGFIKLAGDAGKVAEEISLKAIEYGKPTADSYQSVTLPNGQVAPFNKSTGTFGTPYGQPTPPAVSPPPVTDEDRKKYGLPPTGAFTIAPGEAPKPISEAGSALEEAPLDQPSIDFLAQRLLQGDNTALSNLGFGSSATANRSAVIKRATEMSGQTGQTPADQIANQVQLGGDKQAGRTVGALGGRISTFAEEAAQTGELALQASEAVPRNKWVPVNSLLQMGEAASSDPNLSRLMAANNEFATTYAKATNPSGIPTDEGRAAAFRILNVAKDQDAYEASIRQLQKGIRAIQSSVGTSRSTIRNNVAAPQFGGIQAPAAGDPLSSARDAISRGAPRGAVIQRLQQNGINPAGL